MPKHLVCHNSNDSAFFLLPLLSFFLSFFFFVQWCKRVNNPSLDRGNLTIPVSPSRADDGSTGSIGAVGAHGAGVECVVSNACLITQVARGTGQTGTAVSPTFLVIVGCDGAWLRVLKSWWGKVWTVGQRTPLWDQTVQTAGVCLGCLESSQGKSEQRNKLHSH